MSGGPRDESELVVWRTRNQRGAIRAVIRDGNFVLAVDEDEFSGEFDLHIYRRANPEWRLIFDADDVGYHRPDQTHGGGWAATIDGGIAWNYGRADPDAEVQVRYEGQDLLLVADADGWWAIVRETSYDSPTRQPQRIQ